MKNSIIFNIQKYSIHDGDGIRTTVFFKGCPLNCKWCHNPESQCYKSELMFQESRCTGCGDCIPVCPNDAIALNDEHKAIIDRNKCIVCGKCVDACHHEAREIVGEREYEIKDLVKEIKKDQMFYENSSGGGVTLSGGEVMDQDMDYVESLCRAIYDEDINIYIDTCGYTNYNNFKRILPYVHTFLYDIKDMNEERHKESTGKDNKLILENLIKLNKDGARIYLRLPLIEGINTADDHIDGVIEFLKTNRIMPAKINLLKYHDTGKGKYLKLGRKYEGSSMKVPDEKWLNEVINKFQQNGFINIKIGG